MIKIGIIGGSGLDNPEILDYAKDLPLVTPYGNPSSDLRVGKIKSVDVVLLARHGREHTIPPTQINNKANIWALKQIGCTHIIATTAVGSLREEIVPGMLVIMDQFIDFTRRRDLTFFDEFKNGEMKHTPMADPFDKKLRDVIINCARKLALQIKTEGTVITIEGPRFSTRAESNMFRQWGADIINMSTAPECILANEIGLPYSAIAMSTDYDCWKVNEEPVTWEAVIRTFNQKVKNLTNLLVNVIPEI